MKVVKNCPFTWMCHSRAKSNKTNRLHERYLRTTSQQTFVLMKSSWKRLEDVFHLRLQNVFKTSGSRQKCSPQDENVQDVFKTSFYPFSRRLQDVLVKTNIFVLAIRLTKTSSRCLQNVFKTSWKTSSRHFQDIFKTPCKDIFKRFSRRIIKLNCSC